MARVPVDEVLAATLGLTSGKAETTTAELQGGVLVIDKQESVAAS